MAAGNNNDNKNNDNNNSSSLSNGAAAESQVPTANSIHPLLPVPDLAATLDRYLETIRPWLAEDQMERTRQLVDRFRSGAGRELHQRLLERVKVAESIARGEVLPFRPVYEDDKDDEDDGKASNSNNDIQQQNDGSTASLIEHVPVTRGSWLIDWWNQYSYLRYREPVVINVSFFFTFPDDPRRRDPLHRAATMIYYAMDFRQQVIDGTLSAELMRNAPLCMRQYQFLFNATRLPRLPSDHVAFYDPRRNGHVAVVFRDRYFTVECFAKDKQRLAVVDIYHQLYWIITNGAGDRPPADQRISYLTADHRDRWAVNYNRLRSHSSVNRRSLKRLQSAAFLVCLDESAGPQGDKAPPDGIEEISRACWHGDGSNRWYDKSFQLILFSNGKTGCLGEHSMFDATVPARLCDYILDRCFQESHGTELHQPNENNDILMAQSIPFDLATDELQSAVREARTHLKASIDSHDLRVLQYAGYGKDLIKQFQVSPDSYVQMAIQLAYFKMMGSWVATYETAGMRRYSWGRTETCRSVSVDSVSFVKAMEDPCETAEQKAYLARAAIQTHSKYMADCLAGKGIDRHFLGLRLCMHPDESVPELFMDPAYNLSCHWTLSTSQIPTQYFEGYGWGEVVPDGFGVAYMVKDNSLHFNLTGLVGESVPDLEQPELWSDQFRANFKRNRVQWLRECLSQSLDEMRYIFSPAQSPLISPLGVTLPPVSQLSQVTSFPRAAHLSESALDCKLDAALAIDQRKLERRLQMEDQFKSSSSSSSSQQTSDGEGGENESVENSSATSAPPQNHNQQQQSSSAHASIRHRAPSIQSTGADSTRRLGFTLAYPARQESGNLYAGVEGVVGEDVGFIELDWGETRSGDRGKKIMKMLTRLAMGGSGGDSGNGQV